MQKTEQRAFAAVNPDGEIIANSVFTSEYAALAHAVSCKVKTWPELWLAGWRIRPVIIRVEDEEGKSS